MRCARGNPICTRTSSPMPVFSGSAPAGHGSRPPNTTSRRQPRRKKRRIEIGPRLRRPGAKHMRPHWRVPFDRLGKRSRKVQRPRRRRQRESRLAGLGERCCCPGSRSPGRSRRGREIAHSAEAQMRAIKVGMDAIETRQLDYRPAKPKKPEGLNYGPAAPEGSGEAHDADRSHPASIRFSGKDREEGVRHPRER